jgi:hypothetical protein
VKYQEPEVVCPRELQPGDQVAFSDAGTALHPIVGDQHGEEPVWLTLVNEPAQTTHMYSWSQPVPDGNTALNMAGRGWVWGVYPRVWARREIK